MTVAVIGNDSRQKHLARLFNRKANTLYLDGSNDFEKIKGYLSLADTVILPYPFTRDGVTVNTTEYKISDIVNALKPNCNIYGGGIEEYFNSPYTSDYSKNEVFLLKNALYTAEGAVSIAIENTDISLNTAKILIIGNGRIGKYLSKILSSFCTDITVSARKTADFEYIKKHKLKYINTNTTENLSKYDIIFNTVGQSALCIKALKSVKPDTLVIDLASKNSGLNITDNYIDAKALPTKYSPKSSATALFNSISKEIFKG